MTVDNYIKLLTFGFQELKKLEDQKKVFTIERKIKKFREKILSEESRYEERYQIQKDKFIRNRVIAVNHVVTCVHDGIECAIEINKYSGSPTNLSTCVENRAALEKTDDYNTLLVNIPSLDKARIIGKLCFDDIEIIKTVFKNIDSDESKQIEIPQQLDKLRWTAKPLEFTELVKALYHSKSISPELSQKDVFTKLRHVFDIKDFDENDKLKDIRKRTKTPTPFLDKMKNSLTGWIKSNDLNESFFVNINSDEHQPSQTDENKLIWCSTLLEFSELVKALHYSKFISPELDQNVVFTRLRCFFNIKNFDENDTLNCVRKQNNTLTPFINILHDSLTSWIKSKD